MFRLPKMFFKHWVGGRDSPSKNDLFYGKHESPRSCFSNLSRDLTCRQRTSSPLSFSGLFGRFCDRSLTVPFSFPRFPDRSLKVSLNKPCSERYRFPRSLTVPFRFPSSPPLKGGTGNGLRGDKRVGARGTRKDHEKSFGRNLEPEFGEPDLVEVEFVPGGRDGPVLFEPRDGRESVPGLARDLVSDVGLGCSGPCSQVGDNALNEVHRWGCDNIARGSDLDVEQTVRGTTHRRDRYW